MSKDSHDQEMSFPGRRLRHSFPPGHQGHAQGNAAGGEQAADPVRGGGGAGSRPFRDRHRHRPRQAFAGRPLRHQLRAGTPDPQHRQGKVPGRHPSADRRVHLRLHPPGGDEGPRPRHPHRSSADRRRAVRRGPGRRPVPEPRRRQRAEADGQAVQPVPLLHRGDPGSAAGRDQQVRRDRRRDDPRRYLPGEHHGREAEAGRGAVEPGDHRPLHPDPRTSST